MPSRSDVRSREPGIERVFKALGDPTRRAVVERLGRGPVATSDLAEDFDMALPSFAQHMHVLEDTGLVASSKQGRVRIYRLVPDSLGAAESWLSEVRDLWERRLDQLDAHLLEMRKDTS
jgi:DNA-binding transcriptional ArsR family regulator